MEFHKKLSELRRAKGLTQEELAAALYVSRTAVSKWESGRGYPNIESLKAIASFFSVTLDELLSTNEAVALAEEDQKRDRARLCNTVFGCLDLSMLLLLVLPLFAAREEAGAVAVSLLSSGGVRLSFQILSAVLIVGSALFGALTLVLKGCERAWWKRSRAWISLGLGTSLVLLMMIGLHPYAAVFAFALLAMKVLFWR